MHIINIKQWMHRSSYARSILRKVDIFHLQRVLVQETHDYIDYWRSQGKAVVVDWDDNYGRIDSENAAKKFWLDGMVEVSIDGGVTYDAKLDPHPLKQFEEGLRHCTAGITPSHVMLGDYNKDTPVFTIENYLDARLYHSARKHNNDPCVVLGYGASLSHTKGLRQSGLHDALRQMLQERDNVRLLIVGDERLVKQLPVRRDRVWFSPYTSWWTWQKTLKRYDIGLAPLSGDYDDRRSSLKVAEYLMSGLPFVATKSPVYEKMWHVDSGRFVKPGHDKESYDERVEDWYSSTIDIIDNIEDYRERAKDNIMKEGMKYSVDENVDAIIGVYKEIIELER